MPYIGATILIFLTYLAIGLPDGLLGVAWPSMRAYFHVPIEALGLLPLAATPGYLIAGFYSGSLTRKFRIPVLVAAGCATSGLILLFYTISPSWYLIIAAAAIAGAGTGLMDAGINLFVTQNLGKKQMQWLHACWGIGITIGPFALTAALGIMHSWKPGYILAGGLQVLLAAAFALSTGRAKWGKAAKAGPEKSKGIPLWSTFFRGNVIKSMGLFFMCSGTEAVLSLWTYSLLTESRGIAPAAAGIISGSYWAFFTVSRVLAGFYTRYIRTNAHIIACLISGFAGVFLLWLKLPGIISLAGVVLAGFSIAPVFPALMSATKARVGAAHERNTVGMQMSAAASGAAVMPGIAGLLARSLTLEAVPVMLMVCFALFALLYAAFLAVRSRD
jgi:fucose permease